MCYEASARPPLPPVSGGAHGARTEDVVLTADDGNRFDAYSARDEQIGGPGVVILPDIRGLHDFYRDLAIRFAETGVHATAFDYFGRTAGVGGPGSRGDDFDFMLHVRQTRPETVALDVAGAVAHVRSAQGGGAEAVFTVGFCFGGRASFNQAAQGHGLSGVIGFYGGPQPRDDQDANAPTLLAPGYRCPVLGLFGGADQGIPPDAVEGFRRALDGAGVPNELVAYEGAPHSFFDRSFDAYARDCEDAWARMLAFIREHGTP